jgi:hypothetical protein
LVIENSGGKKRIRRSFTSLDYFNEFLKKLETTNLKEKLRRKTWEKNLKKKLERKTLRNQRKK